MRKLYDIFKVLKVQKKIVSLCGIVKVGKNRKQIFQPKLLPKTEPSNLFLLFYSQDRKKNIGSLWKTFWLENLLSNFTDL